MAPRREYNKQKWLHSQSTCSPPPPPLTCTHTIKLRIPSQLSDGWYSVGAQLDRPLTHLLKEGRISIGTKLCVFGADLCGAGQEVKQTYILSYA